MKQKKYIKILVVSILLFLFYIIPLKISAYQISKDDKIYVSGEAIGIKLNCGIEVVGTFGVERNGKVYKPWESAGIVEGDKILSLDGVKLESKADILGVLSKIKNSESKITYKRNDKIIESVITPMQTDDGYSLGLYIRDSILGVGTLTYYIEDANVFGSLGHKITNDEFFDGEIYEAEITGIILPTRNEAGEKKATISNRVIGEVKENTNTGVHGTANNKIDTSNMKLLPFKTKDQAKLGEAEIWTCINGNLVEKFKINITSLKKQQSKDIKGITFSVIDKELLSKTGGIVQGMSGSPIIQDGAIIGAVTHVSLKNSTVGYGIYIEFMFEDMGIEIK